MIEVRREVRPVWPVRLPRAGMDGVARSRGGVLERLLDPGAEPAYPADAKVWTPTRETTAPAS